MSVNSLGEWTAEQLQISFGFVGRKGTISALAQLPRAELLCWAPAAKSCSALPWQLLGTSNMLGPLEQ